MELQSFADEPHEWTIQSGMQWWPTRTILQAVVNVVMQIQDHVVDVSWVGTDESNVRNSVDQRGQGMAVDATSCSTNSTIE